jgi:hypothetical protein
MDFVGNPRRAWRLTGTGSLLLKGSTEEIVPSNLLSDPRLYEALLKFDQDLAAMARAAGCACGGVLHSAVYPRRPRGAPVRLPDGYDRRYSFCCAKEGCRARVTPPSVRFLGHKVHLAAVIVLASAMRHGLSGGRASTLREWLGVSRQTLARWREWWTSVFAATSVWYAKRALVVPPVANADLPGALLDRFSGATEPERLLRFLAFICPATTRSAGHLEGILMLA